MVPLVHLKAPKGVQGTFVVMTVPVPFSDLIPHAPSSTGPVLLTTANVNPGTPPVSTISCTVSMKSGVRIVADVPLRVDRRSLPAVISTMESRNQSSFMVVVDRDGVV